MEVNRFKTDANAMSMPWVESPFFMDLAARRTDLTSEQIEMLCDFNRDGYIIVDLDLTDVEIQNIIIDMYAMTDQVPKQAEGYHYNESPRLFEGWKQSKNILQLSLNKKVMDILRLLYGREPIPFQTINFLRGTEQPLHSDTLHFHSSPAKWVTACWVALQDMNVNNGPLKFIPGSHKLPIYTFQDLNLPVPEYSKQFDSYAIYEQFIQSLVDEYRMEYRHFLGKRGQAIIWAANLLHGGSKTLDKNSTRLSQVTHYYFEGCEHYYCPMFSDPANGIISKKDLTNKKFI